jgi:hypothetical protein
MRANYMWDVWNMLVRTFLNEFRFFWVFSLLATNILVNPGHTRVLPKSKSLKMQSPTLAFAKTWPIFSSLPENSKCVRRGQPYYWRYQYHMVPQLTTNSTWSCPLPQTMDLLAKKIILFCPNKWRDQKGHFFFLNAMPIIDV